MQSDQHRDRPAILPVERLRRKRILAGGLGTSSEYLMTKASGGFDTPAVSAKSVRWSVRRLMSHMGYSRCFDRV